MIRGPLLRIYKTLHTWVGIVAGMALFICFYAGALTMFMEPLSRWAAPASQAAQNWPNEAQVPALMRELINSQPMAPMPSPITPSKRKTHPPLLLGNWGAKALKFFMPTRRMAQHWRLSPTSHRLWPS